MNENSIKTKIKKNRLDVILFERGFFDSREKAKIAIMEGNIYVNNIKEDKPGTTIKEDATIEFRGNKMKYVSRGGYKLEKAINEFNIDLNNKICMDIGSSTGGFTDCMLQNGATKVYAIDCGTNQLAYTLRKDERVISLENTNARYLTKDIIDNSHIDFVSIDVSFISLTKILPTIYDIVDYESEIVCLIKPQFEAGKEFVNNGVITDIKIHTNVVKDIIKFAIDNNFKYKNFSFSPIKGPKGNIEYLLYLIKSVEKTVYDTKIENLIDAVISKSHQEL